MEWYEIANESAIDSPSLLLYKDRLDFNLNTLLEMVGMDPSRLMPHVKTNKSGKVISEMIAKGITRFKAATIAEAELAAQSGAKEVLISHQLVGPKIDRFLALRKGYTNTHFTLIDNVQSLQELNAKAANRLLGFYLDVNNGMHRSGIVPELINDELLHEIKESKNLYFRGLHVYDGQHRNADFEDRKSNILEGWRAIKEIWKQIKNDYPKVEIIAGGTPSFSTHLLEKDRVCSPGTCVFWDAGYEKILSEQPFKAAVVVFTRIISKPTKGIITVDMGHKAVASENSIDKRIQFLNLMDYEFISQSEEHGVLKVENWDSLQVGDVLYGIPYHICPTVNLYEELHVVELHNVNTTWNIEARKRRITY